MNQRFFRLLAVCLPLLLAVVPVRGQDSAGDGSTKETGLSIDIREKPLSEVLTQLQQLSGCNFLYDADAVEDVPKITLKMKAAALTDILDRIAEITRLEYTRVDNTFTFGSGGATDKISDENQGSAKSRLTGKVVDGNGEPLAGATVMLVGSGDVYSLTDLDGNWTLNAAIPSRISVSYLGFVTKEIKVDSASPVTVQLQEDMDSGRRLRHYGEEGCDQFHHFHFFERPAGRPGRLHHCHCSERADFGNDHQRDIQSEYVCIHAVEGRGFHQCRSVPSRSGGWGAGSRHKVHQF